MNLREKISRGLFFAAVFAYSVNLILTASAMIHGHETHRVAARLTSLLSLSGVEPESLHPAPAFLRDNPDVLNTISADRVPFPVYGRNLPPDTVEIRLTVLHDVPEKIFPPEPSSIKGAGCREDFIIHTVFRPERNHAKVRVGSFRG